MTQAGQPRTSLEDEAARLVAILNSAVTPIITIDSAGRIESVNPATTTLFGYAADEIVGRNVNVLMPEPYHSQHDGYLARYLATGERRIIGVGREVTARRNDGSTFPISLAVSEFVAEGGRYFTGIITDLTAFRAAEQALQDSERRLAQAQKLEAIGQLAGGIAHDFNNQLTVITGNLELAEMRLDRNPGGLADELRTFLEHAQKAADASAQLTDRLLTFGRRRVLEPRPLVINELVVTATELLKRTLGEHVAVSTKLAPDLWLTLTDVGQVENAIVNLAINARDAMTRGGRLLIETKNVIADDDNITSGSESGDYVLLSVSDTGTGMPRGVLERAFEPFFTTKEVGRGTGLGLAMVYGFAKQSGGYATIYSELGHGTTVNIYLPRAGVNAGQTVAAPASLTVNAGGGETILVVEDEERVLRLAVTRLEELGYRVLEASNGVMALQILDSGTSIDLVFTDLIMPCGVSGLELARRAHAINPAVKVLLTTGYSQELINAEDAREDHFRVLRKPYRLAELAKAIRDAIAS